MASSPIAAGSGKAGQNRGKTGQNRDAYHFPATETVVDLSTRL